MSKNSPCTTHHCAATGCGRRIPTTQLMCSDHWSALPAKIKTNVYSWFGAKMRGVQGADRKANEAATEAINWLDKRKTPQMKLFR